ncbi:unnamed protein product, partial [Prorocentrum cordatum]
QNPPACGRVRPGLLAAGWGANGSPYGLVARAGVARGSDGAESPVPRSLLKEFEAVSDYPGQPDAEPLVPRRRLRGLRALSGRGCSAVAAALAAVGLLAAAAAASPWRGAEPKGPRGAPAGSLVLQGKQEQHSSQDGCGDAAAGDGCFEHVAWAREHGILQHPDLGWYPGLTPSSPASSFQRVLFRQGMGGCRRPCGDAAGPRHASARGRHESGAPGGSSAGPSSSKVDGHLRSSARAAGSSKKKALEASKQRRGSRPKPGPQETQAARRGPRPEEGDAAPERSAADAPAAAAESREQPERSGAEERRRATGAAGVQKDCHDAAPGEQCYGQIQWAMQTGVASNPEWYPGLNASSAFQDFQAFFSSEGRDGCREPCATGHWHGLPADSAAAKSRREKPVSSDVQAQIAAGLNGGPELFCWMLFKAHSYESGLVQLQLTNGYNIFACDAYALFTDFPTRRRAALRRRRRRRRQRGAAARARAWRSPGLGPLPFRECAGSGLMLCVAMQMNRGQEICRESPLLMMLLLFSVEPALRCRGIAMPRRLAARANLSIRYHVNNSDYWVDSSNKRMWQYWNANEYACMFGHEIVDGLRRGGGEAGSTGMGLTCRTKARQLFRPWT